MTPRRIAIKLFSTRPEAPVELHPFIGVFHRFIQEGSLPGLLLDVADYAHVPEGPGVVLIGHDVDYGIDLAGGRSGLLTTRKRTEGAALEDLFPDTLARALVAAAALEAEAEVDLRLDTGALELALPDRLAAPNTDAAYELLTKALEPVARTALGDGIAFERVGADDPRRMLTVRIGGVAGDRDALLARVGGAGRE